jgi:hypothetical protein
MKTKILLIVFLTFIIGACKKSSNNTGTPPIPINASMEAGFNFKRGSYWIYKDSVSGIIDSAYVNSNFTESTQLGCVLMKGLPYFELQTISISVADSSPSYIEIWTIGMVDSIFSFSLYSNKDSLESRLNLQPFTFPFRLGNSTLIDGCLLYMDSACVSNTLSSIPVNNQQYQNTTLLSHASRSEASTSFQYNDCFYLCPGVGFVKMVFNHPAENVHRVLELQRYYIAK